MNFDKIYSTSEIAKIIGIHPNTVRLYEKIGFIYPPKRKENTYRIFTDEHIDQIKVLRLALKSELIQNGLRKQAIRIIEETAHKNYQKAIEEAYKYIDKLDYEEQKGIEAIEIARKILEGSFKIDTSEYTRKEISENLDISIDTLRNWEMNGLLDVKRGENGYRKYNNENIKYLKIIRTLRFGNYSLTAILRFINDLRDKANIDIKKVLSTPRDNEIIISRCDVLLTSISKAKEDTNEIIKILDKLKNCNPPL